MAALIRRPHPRRARSGLVVTFAVLALTLAGPASLPPSDGGVRAAGRDEVSLFFGGPSTLDPARQSDIGSAAYSAQLYESLTAFDLSLTLRPALARSWDISADGTRIAFHLRPDLTFSDGSPLGAEDVVGSWLRVIDPAQPSQLSSLLLDVRGAADYLAGRIADPGAVGLRASGHDVLVELERPGADFPAIVSSPTFGIVPAAVWRDHEDIDRGYSVGSGAYVVDRILPSEVRLVANTRYWAGPPLISTVHLLTSIGGRSPVAAFEAGDVDYTGIQPFDAPWIRYDATLGPQLRAVPSLSLSYVGFTTTARPFDEALVREAFGAAVDWARLVALRASGLEDVPADSMVPPGIPGGGDHNWLPAYDPARARELLQQAGYPGGAGFPPVDFAIGNLVYVEAIVADLKRELGVTVRLEALDSHFERLHDDPPAMWTLGWVADYPGANDFLGVLLGSGSSNNYGRWSSPAFDRAIADALGTRDTGAAQSAYERALATVQAEVPVVPIAYGNGWALARDGLLGAGQNGLQIPRLAGLAWR